MLSLIPIRLAGQTRNLKFGSQAARDALIELQARVPSGLLGGLKLQFDQACRLLEAGDLDAVAVFLKHGLKHERRGLTDETVFSWLDDHCDPGGNDGSLVELAEPIIRALSAAGLVERRKEIINEDGTKRTEIERPHLAARVGE